jgi:hypothetical protein
MSDAFSNRVLGAATIDRLLHGAYKVVLEGKAINPPGRYQHKNLKIVKEQIKKHPKKGGEKS